MGQTKALAAGPAAALGRVLLPLPFLASWGRSCPDHDTGFSGFRSPWSGITWGIIAHGPYPITQLLGSIVTTDVRL